VTLITASSNVKTKQDIKQNRLLKILPVPKSLLQLLRKGENVECTVNGQQSKCADEI
jgi:hypothetical protein